MRKYDTVIFDMDGTVLNTLEDLCDSANHALALQGYPERTPEEIRRFVGAGAKRLMELCVPGGQQNSRYEECLQAFRNHYRTHMYNKTKPYPGIPELLQTLQAAGFHMAIVSNKPDPAVRELARHYFSGTIPLAVGEREHIRKKPAPDSVLAVLEELGSSPDRAVLVGDSGIDIQTAKNAGLVSVGVTWGFRDRSELEAEGADHIIDRPDALICILQD